MQGGSMTQNTEKDSLLSGIKDMFMSVAFKGDVPNASSSSEIN